jgi:UDP-N-acetylglucosamine--N-acetylmuramyl-(pentapeptide) pyrophosphoryl-undecaprenol N-acetylglucosamine transferase
LVKKWIEAKDLGGILRKASLVISRAGANTLIELALLGIPAIVIPLPYLYKNEQVENAVYFKKLGLCEIIYQQDLGVKILLSKITNILKNYQRSKRFATLAKGGIISSGAKKLIQQILIYEKN